MHNTSLALYVTHATSFDFQTVLYQPLQTLRLTSQHKIILPHETTNKVTHSKEIIKNSDVILAEVSYPSTGQGIELGWAETMNKPIICCYQLGKTYSSSLTVLTKIVFVYQNSADFLKQLKIYLIQLKNFGRVGKA